MNPTVDQWYKADGMEPFQVVGVDEESELIEIQYEGGDVEEWETSDWKFELENGRLRETSPPLKTEYINDDEDDSDFDEED